MGVYVYVRLEVSGEGKTMDKMQQPILRILLAVSYKIHTRLYRFIYIFFYNRIIKLSETKSFFVVRHKWSVGKVDGACLMRVLCYGFAIA